MVRSGTPRSALVVVHGEVSTTAMLGYANKGHYGFLGHSVLGRWVNFGAGTTTSNLKSTTSGSAGRGGDEAGNRDTSFLGFYRRDAKTAIGRARCRIGLGAGASIFDDVRAPKYVAPFSWGGSGSERMTREKFLATVDGCCHADTSE